MCKKIKYNGLFYQENIFYTYLLGDSVGNIMKVDDDSCKSLMNYDGDKNIPNAYGLITSIKTGSGASKETEYFAYDTDGKLIYTEKGTEEHDYIYANGKLWCEVVTKGNITKTYYHHTDHLGTTICITDSTGKVVWECEYEAFGKCITKSSNTFTPNFTGKFLDEITNLYYFNARWYDSETGKFITEDPVRDGNNWYVYCRNNPLKYIDPMGLSTTLDDFKYQQDMKKRKETKKDGNSTTGIKENNCQSRNEQTSNNSPDILGVGTTLINFKNGIKKGFASLLLYFFDSKIDKKLNKELNKNYEGSLYFQKYTNELQKYYETDALTSWLSLIPLNGLPEALVLLGFLHNYEKRDGMIVADNITGFIKGAQLEINRITEIQKESSDDKYNSYLNKQKELLKQEIDYNLNYYSRDIVFANIYGTPVMVDKNYMIEKASALPTVDYELFYSLYIN